MTLRRLLEESTDPNLLAILRSADEDTLPDGALERALVAVGAGSAVFLGAGLLASSTTPGFAWSLVVRQLLLSMALGVGVTATGVALVSSFDRGDPPPRALTTSSLPPTSSRLWTVDPAGPVLPAPPPEPTGAAPTVTPMGAPPRWAAPAGEPIDTVQSVPSPGPEVAIRAVAGSLDSGAGAAVSPPPLRPPPAGTPAEASLLAREIALIDAAGAALKRGDPAATLAVIDRYELEILHKSLGVEAALLRIEALVALGRRAEAEPIARRLLASGLAGQHTDRLKKLISQVR